MRVFDRFSEQELEVLRARAARIAVPLHTDEPEESSTILLVKIHSESYGIPLDEISAVYEDVSITPVPNVPEFALGIANIRGRIIFVLDLGSLLDIPGNRRMDGSLPVIALTSDLEIAFQVDSIEGIDRLPASTLTNNFPNLSLTKKSFLQGLSPDGKALLNVTAILDDLITVTNPGLDRL